MLQHSKTFWTNWRWSSNVQICLQNRALSKSRKTQMTEFVEGKLDWSAQSDNLNLEGHFSDPSEQSPEYRFYHV